MSGGIEALKLKEEDVVKLLAAGAHLGTSNVGYQMENYVYKRRTDGTHIINLSKTWEKLLVAARVIVNIENPADICVISSRPYGTRAVLKFAHHTGATPVAGRFTPGAFTNQIQKAFREPRLLIVCDPQFDHQAVTEASYVNLPVIAFCNTDSPMRYLDVAIPCNNKGIHSIGLMWWLLAREVLRMRGSISRQIAWEIMPDLYFYRDPEEIEKEEQAAKQSTAEEQTPQYPSEWGGATAEQPTEWGAEQMGAPTVPSTMGGGQEWGTSVPPASKDWADSKEWGADTPSKEWGDDLQPTSDWGTSVTMQDANTASSDWA